MCVLSSWGQPLLAGADGREKRKKKKKIPIDHNQNVARKTQRTNVTDVGKLTLGHDSTLLAYLLLWNKSKTSL